MSRDVIKWREHLKELDAQICRKCGKPFSDYIHNLPEGREGALPKAKCSPIVRNQSKPNLERERRQNVFVCVQCNRQMRPKKNGFEFLEMAQMNGQSAEQSPYKLWMGDLWECQDCGQQIVYTDAGQTPIAEHFHLDFRTAARK